MSSTEIDEVPLTASLDVSQQVEQLSREFQRQFDELNQRIEDLEVNRSSSPVPLTLTTGQETQTLLYCTMNPRIFAETSVE